MKLYIKYMVSLRCKMLVKAELKNLGIEKAIIELGMVELLGDISEEDKLKLKLALKKSGLELMDDKRSILIEKIKNIVTEMVHYSEEIPKINFSSFLEEKLEFDYTYLSRIFSEVKGVTIEQYIISHKIERAKELLLYDELSLKEISYKLHYSSVSHLSSQFKKVTGLTPSYFKKLKQYRFRQTLEDLF